MTEDLRYSLRNRLINDCCIESLKRFPDGLVDLTVTDPPYLVNYKDRSGRSILNDVESDWLQPSFTEIYRVMKNDRICISFYGWNEVDKFMTAWKSAGFKPVGHIVFQKDYASNSRYLKYKHEMAFLLAKGCPALPIQALDDVQPWNYSGNILHPNQKSTEILKPLIRAFSDKGDLVLDPFAGSASTALSAKLTGRDYLAIEKDPEYFRIAKERLTNDINSLNILSDPGRPHHPLP